MSCRAYRRLSGLEATNVHAFGDLADARRQREALYNGARVMVAGGGFIGLQATAFWLRRGIGDGAEKRPARAPLSPVSAARKIS